VFDGWQDNVMAEDIARAQGCSEVCELLAKLSSVSRLVFLIRQYSKYFAGATAAGYS